MTQSDAMKDHGWAYFRFMSNPNKFIIAFSEDVRKHNWGKDFCPYYATAEVEKREGRKCLSVGVYQPWSVDGLLKQEWPNWLNEVEIEEFRLGPNDWEKIPNAKCKNDIKIAYDFLKELI